MDPSQAPSLDGDEASPPATLYIGNLSPLVSESILMQLFSRVASVLGTKLIRNKAVRRKGSRRGLLIFSVLHVKQTGTSSGYGFVDLADRDSADRALAAYNGYTLYDRVRSRLCDRLYLTLHHCSR